ncbi:hypothetical protein [Paraliomyxa miuraensis]|uniref:hypothetical protein n=1 Tax=Paraliomyxa miuraensis TaxID=376150 RepID=UPI002254A2A7|nr:hypothetical protein [Paraliomyxa miuraensis]MCX4239492.1 hypothetical protein [Paraliomyxa miuraensis]
MTTIRMAHLRTQRINFAVFAADAPSRRDVDRGELLHDLTVQARREGLRVDKSALVFSEGGRRNYYGTPDLVRYLSRHGISHWTHTLTV